MPGESESAAEKAVSGWWFYTTIAIPPSVAGWNDCWPLIDPHPLEPEGKGEVAIANWARGRWPWIDAGAIRSWVDNDRPGERKAAFVEAVRQEITPHLPPHWGVAKYRESACFRSQSMAGARATARIIYEYTQERLRYLGLTHLPLQHGANYGSETRPLPDEYADLPSETSAGEWKEVTYHQAGISSWTTAPMMARRYAADPKRVAAGERAVIMAACMPVAGVFSIGGAGLGYHSEQEVVVLGGDHLVGASLSQ